MAWRLRPRWTAEVSFTQQRTAFELDVDIDVDVDVRHRHRRHGCCYHDDDGVGKAIAITAAAVLTAAVVGSIVSSPPPDCTTVVINGLTFLQCGSTWLQPQISAGSTTYVVVNPPR